MNEGPITLQGIYFMERMPTGPTLDGTGAGTDAAFEINILAEPEAITFFVAVNWRGVDGLKHKVVVDLIGPKGDRIWRDHALAPIRRDPTWIWTTFFQIEFLPLAPDDYSIKIRLDGAVVATKALPVRLAPEARPH